MKIWQTFSRYNLQSEEVVEFCIVLIEIKIENEFWNFTFRVRSI